MSYRYQPTLHVQITPAHDFVTIHIHVHSHTYVPQARGLAFLNKNCCVCEFLFSECERSQGLHAWCVYMPMLGNFCEFEGREGRGGGEGSHYCVCL